MLRVKPADIRHFTYPHHSHLLISGVLLLHIHRLSREEVGGGKGGRGEGGMCDWRMMAFK